MARVVGVTGSSCSYNMCPAHLVMSGSSTLFREADFDTEPPPVPGPATLRCTASRLAPPPGLLSPSKEALRASLSRRTVAHM